MSLVLAVHFRDRFFEYFLPGLNNRAISVEIPSSGVALSLEVWNNSWSIRCNETMTLSMPGEANGGVLLEGGLTLNCRQRASGERFSIVVEQSYTGYSGFDKYELRPGRITIGSANMNSIQYNTRNLVSGRHATMETDASGRSVVFDTSSNGTYVNCRRITGRHALSFGDVIYILGLKLVYLGDTIAINSPLEGARVTGLSPAERAEPLCTDEPELHKADEYYQRSPRQIELLDDELIEIEAPPNPQRSRRQPLIFTIGPSITMVVPMTAGVLFTMWSAQQSSSTMTSPFMFMGIITSATAAVIGVFWALANYRYNKRMEQEDEERRCSLYRKYLDKMRKLLEQKHASNKDILDKQYPRTNECLNYAMTSSRRLWERNVNHRDFLSLRIGQGDMPSANPITVPKERFSLVDDDLSEEPRRIREEYRNLKNVPVCISLREHQLVGVIGETQEGCNSIAQVMATQIAAYHSYTDVRMAFIYNEHEAETFAFARWLPHTWSEDGSLRMVACDANGAGEVLNNLASMLRNRLEERDRIKDNYRPIPHYVVFISNPSLMENEAVMKYLSAPTEIMGVSTVLLCQQIGRLPNNCTVVIQCDADYSGYYSLDSSFADFDNVAFDRVSSAEVDAFARSLSGTRVRETQTTGAIPQLLTFLDMYKTSRIEDIDIERRWLENRTYESMKAMIGYRGADAPLYLDIHEKYHGPHGLVAGTTGSGKSETLQTYILSLALNYHPYEVSFILIDYKGGGMAGSFERLPHVAGIITNLGGNQTVRALAAINSEIKRRQALFNEYKIRHIDSYIELYRAAKATVPMPHLLIIADEFAELKKEQPEFVRELVSASRVGRSLGVHLILATQKPSGVVDEEIWGNSKFRLCLRVQDKQDSNEMIKRPDAAYIINAGRGYFQVGNDEIFEAFQSGWSGAKYEPDIPYTDSKQGEARMIDLLGKPRVVGGRKPVAKAEAVKKTTQLEAIVKRIAQVAAEQNIRAIDNIWLPPLLAEISLQEIPAYVHRAFASGQWKDTSWELKPVLGIVDDPVNQRQIPLTVDIVDEGHMLVSASAAGGKTTFLQTLLYSLVTTYSPERLHIYIADFGSRTMGVFGALPHVGGIAFDTDLDKVDKLMAILVNELNRRKAAFSAKGIGSFREYIRLYSDVPAVVLAIDNFAAFMETCPKQEANVIMLAREAASYGIYLVVTCTNASDIRSKVRQNIGFGVGLQLADRFEYEAVLNSKAGIIAADKVPGRGLVCYPNPLEFQTALCLAAPDAVSLNAQLRAQFAEIADAWPGPKAPQIPQVPEDMLLGSFLAIPEVKIVFDSGRYLPLGYDVAEATPISVDLAKTFCYSISGTSRSGKTNLLKAFMHMAKAQGARVYVFDGMTRELQPYSHEIGVDEYVTTPDELFELMQSVVVPEFSRRNLSKVESAKGDRRNLDDYLAFEQKIFLFIGDMSSFCEAVYTSEREMKGFMEQMATRGDQHMIYLFACISQTDMTGEYNTKRFQRSFIGWKDGVHLGGDVEQQRLFEFDVPVMERRKKLPAGVGHTVISGATRMVVTPKVQPGEW